VRLKDPEKDEYDPAIGNAAAPHPPPPFITQHNTLAWRLRKFRHQGFEESTPKGFQI
jgi:hypothetical protein